MLTKSTIRPRRTWCFPENRVGFAVGDIHGRADLLERMLQELERHELASASARPLVVFLGDYVDRGPQSREVIDLLISGRPAGFERRYLMGNHERALLDFLKNPVAGRSWLEHGGLETLLSYGVAPPMLGASEATMRTASADLAERMPASHKAFLGDLELIHIAGDYLFVHAGLDPMKVLADQTEREFLWTRGAFLESDTQLAYCIVHGHTPVAAPHIDARRIGLDTGAYATGILSAVRLQSDVVMPIRVVSG